MAVKKRSGKVKRRTRETDVSVAVDIDGTGRTGAATGVNFVDHLITAFGTHAMLDLSVEAKSRDGIVHHLIEDTAITIGDALDRALGDRAGVARFGHACVPMDESLAEASVDLVRRPFHRLSLSMKGSRVEDVQREDLEHFFQSLLQNINACVHLAVRYGDNDHHKAEAAIKSLAVAFRAACSGDPRRGVPSTKGAM